jgi:streptogramin lyase
MYRRLPKGLWSDRTRWLTVPLLMCLLLTIAPKEPATHAASPYYGTLSISNFGMQFLHAQADNLKDPRHALFTLTNGAALWYGILVQSRPIGLQPVAADPFSDIVSAELAQYGLLPPSGIIPLNTNGTFFETVHLAASFSGPGQQMQITINPFTSPAVAFDVLNLLLQLLGANTTNIEIGLLTPGNLHAILDEISTANDLVSLIGDFKNMLQAVPTNTLAVLGDAHACVNDLFKLFANANELQVLGKILVRMLGPAIPGIAVTLASFAAGLGTFLATVKVAKFLADLALSLGSYLFQQGAFPTVMVQSISSVVPTAVQTSTLSPTPVLTPTLISTAAPAPTPSPTITEFPIPTASSAPADITTGPDGNLWFTEENENKIGRITANGTITEFPIPTASSAPVDIATGPDGNLWFTDLNVNKIGRITANGTITEFPIPTANSYPTGITTGSDGNLWFTELNENKIGRITANGTITEFPIPTTNSFPYGITTGPDGTLWFTESKGDKIGRITANGTITEFPIPTTNSFPTHIIRGPDGNLWFTEENGNKIGRITANGTIIEFPSPTANSFPDGITTGPDGNLWFTEYNSGKVERMSADGTITAFSIPTTNSGPDGITTGPDGNLWFTESKGDKIGRIIIH